jgi:hypothetical protein
VLVARRGLQLNSTTTGSMHQQPTHVLCLQHTAKTIAIMLPVISLHTICMQSYCAATLSCLYCIRNMCNQVLACSNCLMMLAADKLNVAMSSHYYLFCVVDDAGVPCCTNSASSNFASAGSATTRLLCFTACRTVLLSSLQL